MSITLNINPYSNRLTAPKRISATTSLQVGDYVYWTTDTDAYVTTDTGDRIDFVTSYRTAYPLLIEINPYSNRLVAPE